MCYAKKIGMKKNLKNDLTIRPVCNTDATAPYGQVAL